jgi:tRNA/rRNA methyltransferase
MSMATTARERDGFKPVHGPVDGGRILRERHAQGQKLGLMFGREKLGPVK